MLAVSQGTRGSYVRAATLHFLARLAVRGVVSRPPAPARRRGQLALPLVFVPIFLTARFEHFDARPGGSYRLVLAYADASAAREVRRRLRRGRRHGRSPG